MYVVREQLAHTTGRITLQAPDYIRTHRIKLLLYSICV